MNYLKMLDARRRRVPWVVDRPPDKPAPRNNFLTTIDGEEAAKIGEFFPVSIFELMQSEYYQTVNDQWQGVMDSQIVATVYEVSKNLKTKFYFA